MWKTLPWVLGALVLLVAVFRMPEAAWVPMLAAAPAAIAKTWAKMTSPKSQ
jgi:hypothetical protein